MVWNGTVHSHEIGNGGKNDIIWFDSVEDWVNLEGQVACADPFNAFQFKKTRYVCGSLFNNIGQMTLRKWPMPCLWNSASFSGGRWCVCNGHGSFRVRPVCIYQTSNWKNAASQLYSLLPIFFERSAIALQFYYKDTPLRQIVRNLGPTKRVQKYLCALSLGLSSEFVHLLSFQRCGAALLKLMQLLFICHLKSRRSSSFRVGCKILSRKHTLKCASP